MLPIAICSIWIICGLKHGIISVTFLAGGDLVQRVIQSSADQLLRDRMVHAAVGLAIPIDETLLAFVIMLDASTSTTGKFEPELPPHSLKSPLIGLLLGNVKSGLLDLPDKLLKILHVVVQLRISSHKVFSNARTFAIPQTADENVLEYA